MSRVLRRDAVIELISHDSNKTERTIQARSYMYRESRNKS